MESVDSQFNKNQLQLYFNQIKGVVSEINIDDSFSNVVLTIGHVNTRIVSLVAKTPTFIALIENFAVGDKVVAKYYLTSNKKNDRYYTTATLLDLQKQPNRSH